MASLLSLQFIRDRKLIKNMKTTRGMKSGITIVRWTCACSQKLSLNLEEFFFRFWVVARPPAIRMNDSSPIYSHCANSPITKS